ncbi:MAG: purine-nucleoside phosphorylase [Bacteroidetes bacterium]|nr:purine-nucleoside phosphorylase [Bacteroidota bacterium]
MEPAAEHLNLHEDALPFIRSIITGPPQRPALGLVLGSGLSQLAEIMDDAVTIATSDIPGYPESTVEGHEGCLIFGMLEGMPVVFVQGRLHVYEGHSVEESTYPIRLLAGMGVQRLIVTNAAGGIHPDCVPGTLMWITDHIAFAFRRIPAGKSPSPRPSGADQSPYDPAWTESAKDLADSLGVATRSGTYLWTLGPSYETKAEIRMFAKMGADAVGMSTVPEVVVARTFGMRVLGLSTITNFAAGLGQETLDHQEVLQVGRQVRDDLQRLIVSIVRDISNV